MITDSRHDCMLYASKLEKKYTEYTVDELANEYCKALDDSDREKQSIYLSALILKFWYTIYKTYQTSIAIGLEYEDFFNWIVEAINLACKYRAWQTGKCSNATQAIQQCITTVRKRHYYVANLDKHRANYNNISLNTPLNSNADSDDAETTIEDTLSYEDDNKSKFNAKDLIQQYINKNKVIEAIILDNIAFSGESPFKKTHKTKKSVDTETGNVNKYVEYYSEFWPYKLMQNLINIDTNYKKYFLSNYEIKPEILEAAYNKMKDSTNQKLYKYTDKTMQALKTTLSANI